MKKRPISPHLQIYRPQITSVLSIFHRITGVGLVFGLLLIVLWFASVACGVESFIMMDGFLMSWFGKLILFGFTLALSYHFCNGLRHLWWDKGWGFDAEQVTKSGYLMLFAALVLTICIWLIPVFAS